MNGEWAAKLADALSSGKYTQGHHGFLAWGVQVAEDGREVPAEWEAAGVLCDLMAQEGVIVPPTKVETAAETTWLYRGVGEDAPPSCMSIPATVMAAAGMELAIGDGLAINGVWRTWAGHAGVRVPFGLFAAALREAWPVPPPAATEEAEAA